MIEYHKNKKEYSGKGPKYQREKNTPYEITRKDIGEKARNRFAPVWCLNHFVHSDTVKLLQLTFLQFFRDFSQNNYLLYDTKY